MLVSDELVYEINHQTPLNPQPKNNEQPAALKLSIYSYQQLKALNRAYQIE